MDMRMRKIWDTVISFILLYVTYCHFLYKLIICIVSEALFCLCRGTNIITLLGCDRISGHIPRLFISLYFSFLSLWILILLVREKHRKTLYRLLLIKINLGRQITYGDKIQNATTTRQRVADKNTDSTSKNGSQNTEFILLLQTIQNK